MPAAWGHALVTRVADGSSNDGQVLDAWFHTLGWGESAPANPRVSDRQEHALRAVARLAGAGAFLALMRSRNSLPGLK